MNSKPLTSAQIDALPASWRRHALSLIAKELRLRTCFEQDKDDFDSMRTIYPTSVCFCPGE